MIDWLDPNREFISHRLYRDTCTRSSGGHHHKDLTVTGRRLDRSVVIDDHPELYGKHRQNAIHVSSLHGDPRDVETLLKVQSFFELERSFKDMRCAAQTFVRIFGYWL
ncbi:CTD phosphatase-like protein [Rhynchospora pubera]|uniref:Mitochondrial import inner membrane translocase subunit TIM50 n=1 Tax=Rhynchospora pubera TaxID=906938 RepID=A0AAV8D8K1_9POAL|nr:CTD phosphatase-like protein [Rhynchospora pubera]